MAQRKQLTLTLTYPAGTTAERLCDVLGQALYRPDVSMLSPLDEEFEKGSTEWDYDDIEAHWEVVELDSE